MHDVLRKRRPRHASPSHKHSGAPVLFFEAARLKRGRFVRARRAESDNRGGERCDNCA